MISNEAIKERLELGKKIYTMKQEGYTLVEIAKTFGIAESQIRALDRVIDEYHKLESVKTTKY